MYDLQAFVKKALKDHNECLKLTPENKIRLEERVRCSRTITEVIDSYIILLRNILEFKRISFFIKRETDDQPKWIYNFVFNDGTPEQPIGLPRNILNSVIEENTPKTVSFQELSGRESDRSFVFLPLVKENINGAIIIHSIVKDSSDKNKIKETAQLTNSFSESLSYCMNSSTLIVKNESLTQMTHYIQNLLDTMTYAVLVIDLQGSILLLNKNTKILFDLPGSHLLGKNYKDIFPIHISTAFDNLIKDTKEYGFVIHKEGSFISDMGWELPIEMSASEVKQNGERIGFLIMAKNTQTSRRLMKLEEMDKLKEKFISTVSHELRSPLTSIKEGVGLIQDGTAGPLNEDQDKLINIVHRNVNWLTLLINDLLDMSRLEADKVHLEKQIFDITTLIQDVMSRNKTSASMKNIKMTSKFSSKNIPVVGDPVRIEQVLINLVSNALKFTHERGKITISAEVKENNVEISVKDDGIGMTKDEASLVFDKFEQFGKKVRGKQKGTGLGLSITKEIIALHNQNIWVETAPDKGSTFIFTLELPDKEK